MLQPWGLHWFRRDLRLVGNAALRHNWHQHQGRTLGLFCFDSVFLQRKDFSHNRFAFFLKALAALKLELQAHGGDLLVVDGQMQDTLPKLLAYLKHHHLQTPALLTFNRDYEPFARKRDEHIMACCQGLGLQVHTERDHLLVEPHELVKADASSYQVYSPFAKAWFTFIHSETGYQRIAVGQSAPSYLQGLEQGSTQAHFRMSWAMLNAPGAPLPLPDALERFVQDNQRHETIAIPPAGFQVAYRAALAFTPKVERYKEDRDFPSLPGTSQLSIYLKNGSLTPWHILQGLALLPQPWRGQGGAHHFVKEIAWREFYYHVLWHRPDVEKQSFLPAYRQLHWSNNLSWFQRWQEGTTGFPIVDAGMRQLRETGWMHNRVRMIVASFLTKDLLIDWQWGERWFMEQLLDGDLAPNNGGWQWAASTGCDPQPYFRIFNPWLQSAKFDPEGKYIKQFVPELRHLPSGALHDPKTDRSGRGYPAPMVAHDVQRALALQMYQEAKDAASKNEILLRE